jgi:SAM-dependent methyltransferase
VSKRDDDSPADMEVGMTTAERRRRRRRGGGLRVPSDNVPRRTNPPVVAPVPEDPSLAMSIAYSFSSDASEPVPRVASDPPSAPTAPPGGTYPEPAAPDVMPTVIDPPSAPVEQADFEMQTREMTAVDLEALGLTDPSALTTTDPGLPKMIEEQATVIVAPEATADGVEIDVGFEGNGVEAPAPALPMPIPTIIPTELSSGPVSPLAERPVRERKHRQKTVALTEEDLEEVREAARAMTNEPIAPAPAPAAVIAPPPPPRQEPTPTHARPASEEPMSVPEIDIQELAERSAESSGEIEVDVALAEESGPIDAPDAAKPVGPAESQRSRSPSAPPPIAPQAATTSPGVHAPTHAQPPPPPKAPPVPPPKPQPKDPPKDKPAARATPEPKPPPRLKPWFVDLFDEDYLRTLPFLTPQATQSEAEFVIEAMGLSPGAQVLDVGCGYGRHAMELAARGFHVVGLDLSTPLLVRGGEEAHRRGLQINFVRGDMRELDFESQFDGAYCLFSTFGYFDDETNKKTVTNIARALKPGGRVLIEILNRDYVIADLPTRVWWEGDGCVVLEEVELNYFSSRIQVNRSVVFDDGRQLEQEISVRAYSLHEIGKLMHAAGFRVLEVSGGYHTRGRFFGNQSRHIIVLAERKDAASG